MSDIEINDAELVILTDLGLSDDSLKIPEYQDVFAVYERLNIRLELNRKELRTLGDKLNVAPVSNSIKQVMTCLAVVLVFGTSVFVPSLIEPVVVSAFFISVMWLFVLLSRLSTEYTANKTFIRENDTAVEKIAKTETELAVVTKILNNFSFRLNPDYAEGGSKS
ncbi:hypothetical protein VCHA53O466_140193 [Vibrio chagasii]|nr:hypothetical protein VCHA53O466_140193 [Vibrio chagasii]